MWRQPQIVGWNYEMFTTRVNYKIGDTSGIGSKSGLYTCSLFNKTCNICISGTKNNYIREEIAAKCTISPLNLFSKVIKNPPRLLFNHFL